MIAAMVPLPALPDLIAWTALPVLALAASRDVAVRDIPNRTCLAVAAIGLLRQSVAAGPQLLPALLAAAVVLGLAVLLWLRGMMGGGDVKLLAAATLLVPAAEVPSLLLAVALAGGVLALVHLGLRALALAPASPRARPPGAIARVLRCECWRIRRGAPLPYGVAISAGAAALILRPGG